MTLLYYNEDTLDILNYIDDETGGFKTTHAPASNVASIEYALDDTYITIERSENGDVFVNKPQVESQMWVYYDRDAMKVLTAYDCNFIDHANAYPQNSGVENIGHIQIPLGEGIEFVDIRTDDQGNIETFKNTNKEQYYWSLTDWQDIRDKRNKLLLSCDWTHCGDSVLSDEKKMEWKVYRQSLRDITSTYETPSDVVWPTPPT